MGGLVARAGEGESRMTAAESEGMSQERSQGTHPTLRNVEHGSHVRMCRSCYRENAAWVLKDQSPGYPKCPFSGDRYEYLPDVVGEGWAAPYRRMIDTVGESSVSSERLKAASITHEVEVSEPETVLEVEA